MPNSVHLIPRNRLKLIPSHLRLAHEYCFFLHDECVRSLAEYEGEKAHFVDFKFQNKAEARAFEECAKNNDTITAMRVCGYEEHARRVILNQITLGMVSDCLHHLYEALRCLEKRKVAVAFNLLRKPLTDNLLYFSWMLGDEDGFYLAFSTDSPKGITSSLLKGRRAELLSGALAKTAVANTLSSEFIDQSLFDRSNPSGLQLLFQHAVHLVTIQRIELQTTTENFNFIFKNYADDDLYELTYDVLPHVLLYLSHVILGLFERIATPDAESKHAFHLRSILGLYLVEGGEYEEEALDRLDSLTVLKCENCRSSLNITTHNAARLILTDSYRCTACRCIQPFPLSWLL